MAQTRIILDLETTGFSTRKNSVWEIAALKCIDNEVTEVLHHRIRPGTLFHKGALALIDFDPKDLEKEPAYPEVQKDLREFIGKHDIVAHNATFDKRFLIATDPAFKWNKYYDFLRTCRRILPNYASHSLDTLCRDFKIPLDHHKAISDVKGLYKLIKKLGWPTYEDQV